MRLLTQFESFLRVFLIIWLGALTFLPGASAQQATPETEKNHSPAIKQDSLGAADEVLKQVSGLIKLPLRSPLKKSLRSRAEIRDYILKQMKEEKPAEERHASERAVVAFGLVPKDFQMEPFLVELLTEQIAGLYDPEAQEFYIADWIPLEDQRMVMAHELAHALEDQHFQIKKWLKAAQPNDDGELARQAVLEGSATAAMIDYLLQGAGKSLKDLPDLDPALLVGSLGDTPTLKKAPRFIKDALIFPYFGGLQFSKDFLAQSGWEGLRGVFEKPPLSTQQILHPELYRAGRKPAAMELAVDTAVVKGEWKQLIDNTLGEFGWKEVLQEALSRERAAEIAKGWVGDRYILLEEKNSKTLLLVYRVRWSDPAETEKFFVDYAELLGKKHEKKEKESRGPEFLSFESSDGGVILRCVAVDCLVVEGGTRKFFDDVSKRIGWAAAPRGEEATAQDATPGAKKPAPAKAAKPN